MHDPDSQTVLDSSAFASYVHVALDLMVQKRALDLRDAAYQFANFRQFVVVICIGIFVNSGCDALLDQVDQCLSVIDPCSVPASDSLARVGRRPASLQCGWFLSRRRWDNSSSMTHHQSASSAFIRELLDDPYLVHEELFWCLVCCVQVASTSSGRQATSWPGWRSASERSPR